MDYCIERADERRIEEIERWLDVEEATYSATYEAWEANGYDGPPPLRGFRCNWDSVKKAWATDRAQLSVLVVQDQAIGFLDGMDILEIRPDMRSRGYGRILAEFMLKQEYDEGRSVIEIGMAPDSSKPFWTNGMGFTAVDDRRWYGGGIYAFKILERRFDLGEGNRVTFSISFYTEDEGYRQKPVPFAMFSGLGEQLANGTVQLPERAYCFKQKDEQNTDYFVKIELDGDTLIFDKAKRDICKELGVERDKGGVFFIERISSPLPT